MVLSGMALREAVANAPTIHEMADALAALVGEFSPSIKDAPAIIFHAHNLIRRARAVPKQPIRY